MIPMMMEEGYRARGWLGLLIGSHLWYAFYDSAIRSDSDYHQQVSLLTRELGDRGKTKVLTQQPQLRVRVDIIGHARINM